MITLKRGMTIYEHYLKFIRLYLISFPYRKSVSKLTVLLEKILKMILGI